MLAIRLRVEMEKVTVVHHLKNLHKGYSAGQMNVDQI